MIESNRYPSIERPWEKYYVEDKLSVLETKRTVWREVLENNNEHLADTAIEFFGARISYRKLFHEVDACAAALVASGVREGDFVTVICAGIPELVYMFYALAKIGAVANLMAPHFDPTGMGERIDECESRIAFVMGSFYEEVSPTLSASCVEDVVFIPTLNASPLGVIKRERPCDDRCMSWREFLARGRRLRETVEDVPYMEQRPLAMVYSSGTTGASKGILLSHDSFQNSIHAYAAVGVDISRGQKFYQIIPPWFSTGLSTCIHLPLSYGTTVLMDPRFERSVFVKNVVRHKPNYAVAATSIYEGFLDDSLVGGADLSHFSYPFEGGEPLRREQAEAIDSALASYGCTARLRTAYGQCECGAAVTTMVQGVDHPFGCSGIPIPGVTIAVFDNDGNELTYGERGGIEVETPCGMVGYYKNPAATNAYFRQDSQGRRWSRTGDVGWIDEDGNLFVEGRAVDVSIVDGLTFYNFDVEAAAMSVAEVEICDVMQMDVSDDGFALVAHVTLRGSVASPEKVFADIQRVVFEKMRDERAVPTHFKVWEAFPNAKSGKRDTALMKSDRAGIVRLGAFEGEPVE